MVHSSRRSFAYTGLPVEIPDVNPSGASARIPVSGFDWARDHGRPLDLDELGTRLGRRPAEGRSPGSPAPNLCTASLAHAAEVTQDWRGQTLVRHNVAVAPALARFQQVATDLCEVTLSKYHEYTVRTQAASYAGAPVDVFCNALKRKYGPDGAWDPKWSKRLTHHAHVYLSAAVQHLRGLHILLENNISTLPIGPLARSVSEASGRTLWLLDPRLTLEGHGARDRVARLFLDDEENAGLQKVVYYAFNHPDRASRGDSARAAKEAIRKPSVFYPSEIDIDPRSGAVKIRGQQLPGPSQFARLVGEMFGEHPTATNGYYAYMSAMTHPTAYAFLETLDITQNDPTFIPYRTDGHFALTVAINTVSTFHNAWRAWIAWTGTGMDEAELVHDAHVAASGTLDS